MKNQILQLMLALLSPIAFLEGGWGMTDEKVQHEGATWNRVFVDQSQCRFNALIPSSTGVSYYGSSMGFTGKGWKDSDYAIDSEFNCWFIPSTDLNDFVYLYEVVSPEHFVIPIDAEPFGAKYAVDLIPKRSSTKYHVRVLSSDNGIVYMRTNDAHEGMRTYFFQNISFPCE